MIAREPKQVTSRELFFSVLVPVVPGFAVKVSYWLKKLPEFERDENQLLAKKVFGKIIFMLTPYKKNIRIIILF